MPLIALCALVALASAPEDARPLADAPPLEVPALAAEVPTLAPASPPEKDRAADASAVVPAGPSQAWRVEVPFAFTATSPASNVETTVAPFVGVRVGTLAPRAGRGLVESSPTFAGFDGALYVGVVREGTPEVASTRSLALLEGRGLFAPARVASTYAAFVPYGFLAASAGGGAVELRAFDEARVRPLFTWATRAGLGAELQIHALTTRIELGAGLRDLRFEITSAWAVGVAL